MFPRAGGEFAGVRNLCVLVFPAVFPLVFPRVGGGVVGVRDLCAPMFPKTCSSGSTPVQCVSLFVISTLPLLCEQGCSFAEVPTPFGELVIPCHTPYCTKLGAMVTSEEVSVALRRRSRLLPKSSNAARSYTDLARSSSMLFATWNACCSFCCALFLLWEFER